MKLRNILVGLSLVAASCTAPAYAMSPVEINRIIDGSNVIVGRGCSGTIIHAEQRLVLTNNHCVRGNVSEETEKIVRPDGTIEEVRKQTTTTVPVVRKTFIDHVESGITSHVADIVATDPRTDLALLQIRNELDNVTTAPFRSMDNPIIRGEVAWAVGNPLGFENSVTTGIISSIQRVTPMSGMKTDMQVYQYSGGIIGGNSGGSLYDDEGNFIGIPFAVVTNATFMGFIIPYTEVVNFLSTNCYADLIGEENATGYRCQKAVRDRLDEQN